MDDAGAVALVPAAVVLWGTLSARLESRGLTAPLVFVAVGLGLHAVGVLHLGGLPDLAAPVSGYWQSSRWC